MKHSLTSYVCKLLLFTLPVIGYYSGRTLYLLANDRYQTTLHGHEVYTSLRKSKQKTKARKLIIGDSTANQLYNTETDTTSGIFTLACNQAIGVVGHYLMLKNYLEAGNSPEDVYMIYSPLSFWDNLDQVYTYHYFLKPFYNRTYRALMSATVEKQVSKLPLYYLCQTPFILTSDWSPEMAPQERDYTFLSPISREYLAKICRLCKEHGVRLHLISPFLSEHWHDTICQFDISETEGEVFTSLIKHYLQDLRYLDDNLFSDHLHLKPHLLAHYRLEMDKRIMKETIHQY